MSHPATSRLEDDTFLEILTWVEEVVEGRGASLAQMMVGSNHNLHERAQGPVTPKCCRSLVSHQVGTEFVLPTQMLRE